MGISREQFIDYVDALPAGDRAAVYHLVQRLIVAWDSDYTRLTPQEEKRHEKGKRQIENGEFFAHDEIDWDKE